jgi:hypothetical protein
MRLERVSMWLNQKSRRTPLHLSPEGRGEAEPAQRDRKMLYSCLRQPI